MFEINPISSSLPEDSYSNHVSVVNKSILQQFNLSTESASSMTSLVLLNDVWKQNRKSFNDNFDQILSSVEAVTRNKNLSNTKTWKSALSSLTDPVSLFEGSTSNCSNNCFNSQEFTGFDQFLQGDCPCHHTEANFALKHSKEVSVTKTFNSNISDDDSQGYDNHIKTFKPRLWRTRPILKGITQSIPSSTKTLFIDNGVEKDEEIKASTNAKRTQTQMSKYTPIYQDVDLDKEEEMKAHKSNVAKITFKTAKEQFLASNPAAKRTLGTSRKAQAKFVSPMLGAQEKQETAEPEVTDEKLKHIDPKMIELIESEIIDKGNPVGWDDIAGLQMAKSVIQEAVVWPLLRPDIFTGLRRPPKGILLFGPPGTGKTLIGKCVAAQCNATFFSISASSLTSKWIGDGEKMVRALFAVARCHQPAVIFIDEIDSLLTQRSDTEHEATRRIKTEFLVQFDGAATGDEDRLLIVGATNRPQELDEAARRRLVKRLYIPLPDADARKQIIANLLKSEANDLSPEEVCEVASLTEGYSGADMKSLCSEAAMGPVRAVPLSQIVTIQRDKVRPVNLMDFKNALQRVRPSVSQDDLGQYVKWNKTYGQGF